MKKLLFRLVTFAALMLSAGTVNSQNIFFQETFPNTFNTAGTLNVDGSFTGGIGGWTTVTSSIFDVEVDNFPGTGPSEPNALRFFVNSASASNTIGDNTATAPVISLNFGACQPSSLAFEFRLYPEDVENSNSDYTLGLQFSSDGGTTWSAAVWSQTSNQLWDNFGEDSWETISVNVPSTYWAANFRYRFYAIKNGGDNSTDIWIDDVQFNASTTGPTIPTFLVANRTQTAGSNNGVVNVGDEFTYSNVVTSPYPIKAVITVEALVNATIPNLDNDGAGITQRFQPQVLPSPNAMTADQTGYAQFKIEFRKMSDNALEPLSGLRYRHFDVDGSVNTNNYTFREAGWVTGHGSILVNVPTDLTDAGNVTDAGPPNPTTWRLMLGELAEHASISSDPDVYFTAVYGSISTIRIRLGYVFDKIAAGASGNYTPTAREYGTEFGCFSLSNQIPTPVKLISFTGTYKNNNTLLNWVVENQVDFSRYEVERSSDGISFQGIATVNRQGNGLERQQYQYADNLSQANGNVYYYRLKMVDIDNKFKYSNVIMIRRDGIKPGLSISPNPIISGGAATVRFETSRKGTVELRIADMSGKVVLRQQNIVYEGANSVAINNLNRLQPGMYMLQVIDGQEIQTTKISVAR